MIKSCGIRASDYYQTSHLIELDSVILAWAQSERHHPKLNLPFAGTESTNLPSHRSIRWWDSACLVSRLARDASGSELQTVFLTFQRTTRLVVVAEDRES